ncbi:SRPBCC family protein [Pseudonocardia sp. C8]|uniref:SRPBCC family protein n=1 Tax=Pseudonocardia sp. C8 TaxID=2762759 RepID=UPI001642889B|nr:SRPBCC family protein [Pseudonocardia sp. C8]MBC3189909.1 SRPBCC family protein [Pseudonocardia sp. C8]
MNDLLDALAAARRRVHSGADGDALAVRLERTYPAGPEDVWDALTTPDRLARWFLPVSGDLRVGGRFRTEGNADGEILACEPPRRLVVSWGAPDSIVTVDLAASGDGRTDLVFEHAVPATYGDAGGALYVGPGWDGALLSLGVHLAGGAVDDPNSPEMLAFNERSVRAWEAAVRASGMATEEQVAAAVEVSLQQFTVLPGEQS